MSSGTDTGKAGRYPMITIERDMTTVRQTLHKRVRSFICHHRCAEQRTTSSLAYFSLVLSIRPQMAWHLQYFSNPHHSLSRIIVKCSLLGVNKPPISGVRLVRNITGLFTIPDPLAALTLPAAAPSAPSCHPIIHTP